MSKSNRWAATLAGSLLAIFAASPSTALAGGEWWLNGPYAVGLSPGNARASGTAHTYVNTTYTNANHTVCPAVSTGYGGYTSTPFSGGNWTAYVSSLCGYGDASWNPTPVSDYRHGAAYNKNVSTYVEINSALYFWN